MDAPEKVLQQLVKRLQTTRSDEAISRGVAAVVRLGLVPAGIEFTLRWQCPRPDEFRFVLPTGRLVSQVAGAYHPQMSPCAIVREVVAAALKHKGI